MKYLFPILLSLVFASCSSKDADSNNTESQSKPSEIKKSDIESIETLFDTDKFDDPVMGDLLTELKICYEGYSDSLDYMHPSCSPRFFKFFPLSKDVPLKNAFILQIKSKTNGFPLRRLLIFIRERGVLVKVNGYVASLIERRKSESKNDDLVLRFNDVIDGETGYYNCLFKWNGTGYEFNTVEHIQVGSYRGRVKEEFKDSISQEILVIIQKNKMIF
jgi:hypothetical protein